MIELLPLGIGCVGKPRLKYLAWSKDGRAPLPDYLFSCQPGEQEKLIDFLSKIASRGLPRNQVVYRKLHKYDNLHELKKKPHRLLFFKLSGETFVFTEAFAKSDNTTDDLYMRRADRRRREYEEQEKAKRIGGSP